MNKTNDKEMDLRQEFVSWKKGSFKRGKSIKFRRASVRCQLAEGRYLVEASYPQGKWSSGPSWFVYDAGTGQFEGIDRNVDEAILVSMPLSIAQDEKSGMVLIRFAHNDLFEAYWKGKKVQVCLSRNPDSVFEDTVRSVFIAEGEIYVVLDDSIAHIDRSILVEWLDDAVARDRFGIIASRQEKKLFLESHAVELPKDPRIKVVSLTSGPIILLVLLPKDMVGDNNFVSVIKTDTRTWKMERFLFPWFDFCDGSLIIELLERDPERLRVFVALCANAKNFDREGSTETPFFFLRDRILFTGNTAIHFDLERIQPTAIERFARYLDLRLFRLLSQDKETRSLGIIDILETIGFTDKISKELLGQYMMASHDGQVIDIIEKEAGLDRWAGRFIENATWFLKQRPDPLMRAAALLTGNLSQRFIAVGLLRGAVRKTGLEAELKSKKPRWMEPEEETEEIFAATGEIPLAAFCGVVDASLAEIRLLGGRESALTEAEAILGDRHIGMLQEAAKTAAAWDSEPGRDLLRLLAREKISAVSITIARIIGERKLLPLKDLLPGMLENCPVAEAMAAMEALGRIGIADSEDFMITMLGHANREVSRIAAKALGETGSEKALVPLLVLDMIDSYLGNKKSLHEEGDVSEKIVRRALDIEYGVSELSPSDMSPERLGFIRRAAPVFFLSLLKDIVWMNGQWCLVINNKDAYELKFNLLFSHGFFPEEVLDHVRYEKNERLIATQGREEAVAALLKSIVNCDAGDEFKQLAAAIFVFSRDYLDFDKRGNAMNAIGVYLKNILVKMADESDFRGILAPLALVELGFREWEKAALDRFQAGDWRGWPRLIALGIKVLAYLDTPRKLPLLKCQLQHFAAADANIYDIVDQIVAIDPYVAVDLYEEGVFELGPMDEALLYGKIGDRRGYDHVLAHALKSGNIEGLKYLGEFGLADAIPVLEEARECGAPKDMMTEALAKVKKRLAKKK